MTTILRAPPPVAALCFGLLAGFAPALPGASLADYVTRAPFAMPAVPVPSFPARSFSIADFGAVSDGRTLNTRAIARAIAACVRSGGGHVIIPPGLWLTGPIELRSNVDLHSERGALVVFTADHRAYPMVRLRDWAFVTISPIDLVPTSPILGIDLHNVALTGDGIFDGAGDTWRPVRRSQTTDAQWRDLLAKGGEVSNDGKYWWPTREAMTGEDYLIELSRRTAHPTAAEALPGRDFRRPPLVYLDNCTDVLVEGVTLRNSPCGALCPTRCAGLTIRDVTLFNEWNAATGDGMDINICRNVLVYRCTVSAGDDGICLKSSGTGVPAGDAALRNVIVADCTVYHGHGGFVLGGYTEDAMRNIWATNCDFVGTEVGLRFKSGAGHGGWVRDVTVDHIFMKDIVGDAIRFDTHYENYPVSVGHPVTHNAAWFAAPTNPVSGDWNGLAAAEAKGARLPEFSDFQISDVYCLGAGTAMSMVGMPHHPIHRIRFRNVFIDATRGVHAADAADILLQNVRIRTLETPAVSAQPTAELRWVN